LQSGTEIMIINPSGEIIVWSNPDEAIKKAKEGALLIIPNPNVKQGKLGNPVKAVLISAFREWEKDKNSPIHVQFGEYNTDKWNYMGLFADEIPHATDKSGRVISPIFEMPKYFTVGKDVIKYRSDKVGINDPVYWLDELISQGYYGINVYPNQGALDLDYPPGN
jgi:hypothetical protein